MTDKIKQFIELMLKRGHSMTAIRSSYLELLQTEEDYDRAIKYLLNNPNASKREDNYEIHNIYLSK